MAAAGKSDLWVRAGSAVVLFAIAGTALWFGGLAFGLLLLVGGALVLVEWFALVRGMTLGGGARTALYLLGPILVLGAMAGLWFIRDSSVGYDVSRYRVYHWGRAGDVPVQ